MGFVDSLTVMLLSAGFSALLFAFYVYLLIRGKKDFSMLIVPSFIFGTFDAVSGFVMSFTWPLPGAYNMLFGDPLLIVGLLLISIACMTYKKMDARILSIFAVFLGIYIAVGTVGMITFHLESGLDLISALGFYIAAALSSLFAPIVYLNTKGSGRYAYWFLFILLILTAFAAFFIGFNVFYSHLQSPP